MLGSADIICSEKQTVFRERVSYEEQIMSKDKHQSMFSPQMEPIVFITLQIFFPNACSFENFSMLNENFFVTCKVKGWRKLEIVAVLVFINLFTVNNWTCWAKGVQAWMQVLVGRQWFFYLLTIS